MTPIDLTEFLGIDEVLERAAARGILPTALRTAELREAFAAELRGRAVFSARTTSAVYLQALRAAIEGMLTGGLGNDKPMLRLGLKRLLATLGYTALGGFPGDAALDIPPAEPGGLTDLSSDQRINLILDTQLALAEGWAQQQRGEERAESFPAWELVRYEPRREPRGSTNYSVGWVARWRMLGGPLRPGMRLMAPKGHPLWTALGDSRQFRDALDVTHPPFAFNSGMGWREVTAAEFTAWVGDPEAERELLAAGVLGVRNRAISSTATPEEAAPPAPVVSPRGMDPDLLRKLADEVRAERVVGSDEIRYSRLLTEESQAMRASYNATPGRAAA